MAKNNIQKTTNEFLKFSDTEIKIVDFHKSSKNKGIIHVEIGK